MSPITSKINTLIELVKPSGIGSVGYIFIMAFVIFVHQIASIEQYLELPSGFSLSKIIASGADHLLTTVIGQSNTEVLVVGTFWAFVGLGVYMFLRGISRIITEVGEGLDTRQYLWPRGVDRNRGLAEAGERIAFRLMAFVGLVVMLFGPVQRVLTGPLWVSFFATATAAKLLVWFMMGCLVLHLFVVLIRLTVLKTRLFD